jgi:hypothetical protein
MALLAQTAWRGTLPPPLPFLASPQVYAGLNQQTGELMAVKILQLVSRQGNKDGEHAGEL